VPLFKARGAFPRPAERGGGIFYFLWAPSHFLGRNISVFRAKYRNLVWKKLGKVTRKQLERYCT
jgi:hypothetical protein